MAKRENLAERKMGSGHVRNRAGETQGFRNTR